MCSWAWRLYNTHALNNNINNNNATIYNNTSIWAIHSHHNPYNHSTKYYHKGAMSRRYQYVIF